MENLANKMDPKNDTATNCRIFVLNRTLKRFQFLQVRSCRRPLVSVCDGSGPEVILDFMMRIMMMKLILMMMVMVVMVVTIIAIVMVIG